jgi:hypothetical protein
MSWASSSPFTEDRSGRHPSDMPRNFIGEWMADALAHYDKLVAIDDIVRLLCRAHVRREFHPARHTYPRCHEMVCSSRSSLPPRNGQRSALNANSWTISRHVACAFHYIHTANDPRHVHLPRSRNCPCPPTRVGMIQQRRPLGHRNRRPRS